MNSVFPSQKSSILILTNSLGGLFSFRKEVVKALMDKGFGITIAGPPHNNPKSDYFKKMGCSVKIIDIDRRGTNPIRDLVLIFQYFKLMKKLKPFAVLTYTIKPNVYGGMVARHCNIPQLANITGLGSAIENPGVLKKIATFLYRFGLKKASAVFCQNVLIKEYCRQHHIGKDRLLIPGSGVNLEWHTYQNYPSQNSTIKLNYIGRVMREKGVEEFFEMAKKLRLKYPQTEFHIFGRCEDPYEYRLAKLQNEGVVVWHGSVTDVRPHIKDSWCTIHPAYHEGMSNVLLETCAAGRPIIASDINVCKEAVDDGMNGYLFKAKNVQDLTAKVEKFINLPYEQKVQMGLAARKKVEREFDRQIVINAYLNEIKKIG